MPALQRPRLRTRQTMFPFIVAACAVVALSFLLPCVAAAQVAPSAPISGGARQSAAATAIKPDLKKAKSAYLQGSQAEQIRDWQAAYEAYTNAVNWAPDDRDYLLRLELVKSR